MKKTTSLLLVILVSQALSAQKLITTYYDWNKTHIHEQYYVNSSGQKNGSYKEYNQQGILFYDYNFVNGMENGPCSEYFLSGAKRYLRSTVTYKSGVFNGPAVYYDDNGTPQQQGNNVNGKKEGKWTAIYPIDDPDLGKLPLDCKYLKSILEYKNNELVDGYVKVYYYPSGKLYREFYMKKGKDSGEGTSYYPNGNLKERNQMDSVKEYFTTKESYYSNGKLESFKEFGATWGYTKDGYPIKQIIDESRSSDGTLLCLKTSEDWIDINNDGSPTYDMKEGPFHGPWKDGRSFETEFEKVKLYQDKINELLKKDAGYWIHIADSLNANNNNIAANELIYLTWVTYPTNKEIHSKYTSVKQIMEVQRVNAKKEQVEKENALLLVSANKLFESKNYKNAKEQYQLLLTKDNNQIAVERIAAIDSIANIEVEKSNTLVNQSKDIKELYEKFTSNFSTKKALPFFVDQNGQPIMKDYFPKGETLYRKADEMINQQLGEYNSATEFDKKFAMGKVVTVFINKLISINEADAKDVDKKMKKASDNEEIKRILEQL